VNALCIISTIKVDRPRQRSKGIESMNIRYCWFILIPSSIIININAILEIIGSTYIQFKTTIPRIAIINKFSQYGSVSNQMNTWNPTQLIYIQFKINSVFCSFLNSSNRLPNVIFFVFKADIFHCIIISRSSSYGFLATYKCHIFRIFNSSNDVIY